MQSFKEFVKESLTSPYKYKPLTKMGVYYISWFYPEEDVTYIIFFRETLNGKYWNIVFSRANIQPPEEIMSDDPFGSEAAKFIYNNKFAGTTKMTYTGNSFKVMSTITSIILEFLNILEEKRLPIRLSFTASISEHSRVRLYRRLVREISKKFQLISTEEEYVGLIQWKLQEK